jgi:hypothetical protein
MPDNWSFVAAAYGLTALVLGVYWRRLVQKERDLSRRRNTTRSATSVADRSHQPSRPGQPQREPDANPSLQIDQQPSRPGHPRREPDANPSLKTPRKSGAP